MPEKRLCPLCGDPANLNKSSKLTIEALLAERDLYRELVNNTSIHLSELKAEVERLKAHTWEQERAAVVAWLRLEPSYRNRPWTVITADIERGEHWPKEGTPQ
jgi:hypothetical protein